MENACTIQQIVAEEYRILRTINNELGTYTPAAWIQVFKQRLSQRPLLSLVPPDVLAQGAQSVADVYVRDQLQATDGAASFLARASPHLSNSVHVAPVCSFAEFCSLGLFFAFLIFHLIHV